MAQSKKNNYYDEKGAEELKLYTENDYQTYSQKLKPIYQNLDKKHKKSIYDSDKSTKAFLNAVDFANKRYKQEFGHSFTPQERKEVAKRLKDEYEEEVESFEGSTRY